MKARAYLKLRLEKLENVLRVDRAASKIRPITLPFQLVSKMAKMNSFAELVATFRGPYVVNNNLEILR